MIEYLKWDSDFFGKKTGRVSANEFILDEIISEAKMNNYDTVYILYDNVKPKLGICENRGLYLSDIKIYLSMKFDKEKYAGMFYEKLNSLSEQDYKDAIDIVKSTAIVSRFYNDSNYKQDKIVEMYSYWLINALNGSFSDGIFVERVNGKIEGVVIAKTDETARLTLIGVNPKIKRHGLGRKLLNQLLAYCIDKHFDRLYSVFSLNNLESFRYHIKTGFTNIEKLRYIYHYINNK